jgi:uncharacterized surface protein with fasciclin (FAS1) repeats
MKDLVGTLAVDRRFRTLHRAIRAAGLVDALAARGPFTIFAPTDEAFARLPAAALSRLLGDRAQLLNLVQYHVAPGRLSHADLATMFQTPSLSGEYVCLSNDFDTVRIGGARLLQPSLVATNGLIHVIDEVMQPQRIPVSG